MEREIDAARLLGCLATWMIDEGLPNSKEEEIAKAYPARAVVSVTSMAIEIMVAHGCLRENLLENSTGTKRYLTYSRAQVRYKES